MPSSPSRNYRIVNDNIHGDIALDDDEWKVVNTATFQRLRSLKQLGMGHLVYPNATHTRFAHSLGVYRIMDRILEKIDSQRFRDEAKDLRLAALLHDVGHYPYSHLMEYVDRVTLTEVEIESSPEKIISGQIEPYPNHEDLGRLIILEQGDIREAIGGKNRATKIGHLFSRMKEADQQLSKLIHSSLDMDRLDYLLRDARASGVAYGEIDLNFLLNNIRVSDKGMLGVEEKALAAAEHFLLARVFMYRRVYFHKTTYGLEEACRQLLKRLRDRGEHVDLLPADGGKIREIATGSGLRGFTDEVVDRIIFQAYQKPSDAVIKALATCLVERRPPNLIVDISGLVPKNAKLTMAALFRDRCRNKLQALAEKYGLQLGQFLLCGPKPIEIEERGSNFTRDELVKLKPEEREELIKIFQKNDPEPKSIVEVEGSLIRSLSNEVYSIQRLYLADRTLSDSQLVQIRAEVSAWKLPPN